MTKEELKNQIIELKENCKKLAEEYRERYNQDNKDRLALNMFYHTVISYNDYERVLALIENRDSIMMFFSAPPVLTEETVEINLKRIEELEKENAELKTKKITQLERRIASIRGSHRVDVKKLNARIEQVERLKKENAELKEKLGDVQMQKAGEKSDLVWKLKTANEQKADQLTKAKTYLKYFIEILKRLGANKEPLVVEAEQFLNSEVEK